MNVKSINRTFTITTRSIFTHTIALALGASIAATSPADATRVMMPEYRQVEQADRPVWAKRVTYVERMPRQRMAVEFNDGSRYEFRICETQHHADCYQPRHKRADLVNLDGTEFRVQR